MERDKPKFDVFDKPGPKNRRGSFSGTLTIPGIESTRRAPHIDYSYSASKKQLEIGTIDAGGVKGAGSALMESAHIIGGSLGAKTMTTATNRPGFFQKQGFDYTPAQQMLNRELGPDIVATAEAKRDDEPGMGFAMVKTLRNDKCTIM